MTTPAIDPSVPPSGPGCVECTENGGWWFHLRRCTACGHIGCCDTSPEQHGTKHALSSGHPVLASFEPGEEWFWNNDTHDYGEAVELAPPLAHPLDQTAPGPRERVPADWRDHLH